ncbi:hypothetical protein V8B97DRAFT_1916857 [Scleroderma yunnanense]
MSVIDSNFVQGGSASIYLGDLHPGGTKVAIKTPCNNLLGGDNNIEVGSLWVTKYIRGLSCVIEMFSHFSVSQPNLVKLLSIASPWMARGNARDYVQDERMHLQKQQAGRLNLPAPKDLRY